MQQFLHPVLDPRGIHLLHAGSIARIAGRFADTTITISRGHHAANAAKLLRLLQLQVRQGDMIVVTADGPSEQDAMTVLRGWIEKHL